MPTMETKSYIHNKQSTSNYYIRQGTPRSWRSIDSKNAMVLALSAVSISYDIKQFVSFI